MSRAQPSKVPGGTAGSTVRGTFAFMDPATVQPDPEGTGLLRAPPVPLGGEPDPSRYDLRTVEVVDLGRGCDRVPSLDREGFAQVDLPAAPTLRKALERVRARGRLDPGDEAQIRRGLLGRNLNGAGGRRLRVVHIAHEGFIMRRQGPNGRPSTDASATNPVSPDKVHHDAAWMVHVDQDVDGTPLRQILRGAGPWMLRHRSPRGANRWAPLKLLNLWIPLDQVVAPLALLDGSTLDRPLHQLRYGLATDDILDRNDAARRVNDIWTVLHHPAQRWYFDSSLELGRAYVFETLSTPHSAFVLPGEARASQLLAALARAEATLDGKTSTTPATAFEHHETEPPQTPSLITAIATAQALLEEARHLHASPMLDDWRARVQALRRRLTRKSLELRLLAV